ncbi:hypothetical protein J437_LFUL012587 [Ladona fulva]|uniref:CNH domain-containing protein n=1 Tax=Ladona fulva TaxID=123851 RepID=A0A8K0KK69_LADFU|nr:hypothetical protein J437_LFUL012587 [Ladona fulva]
MVMQWRHSAAWTAWCPASDTDTVEGFQYLREIQVCEAPALVSLVDIPPSALGLSSGSGVACVVGYKHQFDLVCCAGTGAGLGSLGGTGSSGGCTPGAIPSVYGGGSEATKKTLYNIESSHKPHLLAAIELIGDHSQPEVLLCYNHTCHFQKLLDDGPPSTEFDFHWNSVPTDIVVAFPYVLALTTDCLEIRLIVNGNLVHTNPMPKLKLISAKNDIFFATTAPEFFPSRQERLMVDSSKGVLVNIGSNQAPPSVIPPASPEARPFRFYRIPLHTLSGIAAPATDSKPSGPVPSGGSSGGRAQQRTEKKRPAQERRMLNRRGKTTDVDSSNENQGQDPILGDGRARLASGDKSDLDNDDEDEEVTERRIESISEDVSSSSFLGVAPQKGLSRSCSSSPTPPQFTGTHQSSLDAGK